MTAITLTDIDPSMLVSANQRIHHHRRAEIARYWRAAGFDAVMRWPSGLGYDRAHITLWFTFPDKRRRDVGNLYPYVVKPLIDGMVTDGGLLPDDDDTHLIGPDLRRDPERGPHQIRIEIEELEA